MRSSRGGALPLLILLFAPVAAAQVLPEQIQPTDALERPSDRRLDPDTLLPGAGAGEDLSLPPIPPPFGLGRVWAGPRMRVERFRVVGSTVFAPEEIASVTAPYEGRQITAQELSELRDALTRMYVDAGYVTSGARIPDQSVGDGIVEIAIVEGELQEVSLEGLRRFRPSYLLGRLERAARSPLDVRRVEDELQLLLRDDRIERVAAELRPGDRPGSSLLRVGIDEARPWRLRAYLSNQRTPAVGSEGGGVRIEHLNVLGHADTFSLRSEMTEGFADLEARYQIPVHPSGTRLELRVRQSASEIEERPFDSLDIESDAVTYAVSVGQPLWCTTREELWVGLAAEHRRSDTRYVFGAYPQTPGTPDGEIKLSVLRAFQEWTRRSRSRVIAARSTFNLGIGALRATTHSSSSEEPSGRFFAWLGQIQLAQSLPERWREALLILRAELQLTGDRLLGLEQFAVGGMYTVRGYRESELVRDNGWVTSAELRVPVLRDPRGRDVLQVAPFVDVGRAWNQADRSGPNTLASIGLGLRYRPRDRILLRAYWGGRLRHVSRRGNDIQNNGLHLRAEIEY